MKLPCRAPYRWLPSTIYSNLNAMYHDLKHGVGNILRWIPVIWFDRDWDWEYLAEVMEYKLRRMSKGFTKWGHHIRSDRDAQNMLICAELLKRLRLDNWEDLDGSTVIRTSDRYVFKRHDARIRYDQEYLGRLLGKHLRSWWD